MYLGVDAGGTNTRAVLVDADGVVLGAGKAAGSNPVVHGVENAGRQLESALRQALGHHSAAGVTAAVIGLAGGPTAGQPLLDEVARVAAELGIVTPRLVSDVEVSFAGGSDVPDGVLVLSGTGAAAAELRDWRIVRHVDGNGWLVGDDGSGFWLGRQAVRAVLRMIDGRGRPTKLADVVCYALAVPLDVTALEAAVYSEPPLRLSTLAPLVTALYAQDQVAAEIVTEAADLLLASVAALDPLAAGYRQAVLAGGLLLAKGPLRALVTDGLRERFGLTARPAEDGARGAAKLAYLL
ncbi:N-acetylglucosamine kinase [Kutzneria kofuensis]|uniref:N-acetylglucosamine kinase-like BadF-type ATPase n=1 Tax=Kutzneria kofuensis TaxID=103725 RepID=A0A7W9KC60_9PSEU|nr:BadF/BadG/BcrA/BcrD ATPase family protein [Kutzneria kofuensis]MBB5889750.1 N-acetylglucosamine kinase-like BadF-type ATPase [Kutzneria kofuensis]